MSSSGLTRLAAILLVLAAGSTACQGEAPKPGADQLRELVNRPAVLDEAETTLIAECMAAAGLFHPGVPPEQDERPMRGLLRGAAPLRPEDVREHGYPATLMAGGRGPAKSAVEAHTETLSPDARTRYYRVLLGDGENNVRVVLPDDFEVAASSSGCTGKARQRLYGSVRNFLTVYYLPELVQRRSSAADDDPDVRAAYGDYANCMTTHGFRAATPADALALAKSYYPDGHRQTAGDNEKTLALVDAGCRTELRLHERRAEAADRIALRWLAENETAVSDAHALRQSAVAEARTVIGSAEGQSPK